MEEREVGETIQVPYDLFTKELDLVRNLLSIIRLKEDRESVRSIRPLASLRDEIGPLRSRIKDFTDRVYDAVLPLMLAYSVACLEQFLRTAWEDRFGEPKKSMRHLFSQPKPLALKLRNNLGQKEVVSTAFKANAVAMKRHVLLHRNGVVDKDALAVFMEAGIKDVREGDRLSLSVQDVEDAVDTVQRFAHEVRDVLLAAS